VGTVIDDKYALERLIGEGGMGVVFEAKHLRLRQRLAIKVLRPDLPDLDRVVERFEREARAAAQLQSIHAARVFDVDTLPNGLPYIVMEYLEGRDLDAELGQTGPMKVRDAIDIAIQVADAMGEAHRAGIVHRDLKPSNLFLCRKDEDARPVVKVLDFGISKSTSERAQLTPHEAYFGTPHYAAPEQLRAAGTADARSDIWSLGIIMFELLTGRTPFQGSPTSVIAQVVSEPIPWPLRYRPDLPRALARVVIRALQRDPRRRYQTMEDFARALAPFGANRAAASDDGAGDSPASRKLGEILVDDGVLDPRELERALGVQRRTGSQIGRVLLESGLVSQADLMAALAKQQGIGMPDCDEVTSVDEEHRRRNAPTISGALEGHSPTGRRQSLIAAAIGLSLGIAFTVALACGRNLVSPSHGIGRTSSMTTSTEAALHASR